MPNIFSRYNPPPQVGLVVASESPVQQQFLSETKIDNILRKYSLQQILLSSKPAAYFDTTLVDDFQTTQNKVVLAQAYFDSMPAVLRKKFNNSLSQFVEYVGNPQNRSALEDLGILEVPIRSEAVVDSGANTEVSQRSDENQDST